MRSLPMIASFVASAALVVSSTATAANGPATAVSATQPQAPNAWLMLSAMSSARAIAVGGANAAGQAASVPPPPPYAGARRDGELLPVILWFGLIAIALTIAGPSGRPNSPP